MKWQKEEWKGKAVRALDFPEELVYPQVIVSGNRSVTVQNYKGLIEYGETVLRINTALFIIRMEGKGFTIKTMDDDELVITGVVEKMEYLY